MRKPKGSKPYLPYHAALSHDVVEFHCAYLENLLLFFRTQGVETRTSMDALRARKLMTEVEAHAERRLEREDVFVHLVHGAMDVTCGAQNHGFHAPSSCCASAAHEILIAIASSRPTVARAACSERVSPARSGEVCVAPDGATKDRSDGAIAFARVFIVH